MIYIQRKNVSVDNDRVKVFIKDDTFDSVVISQQKGYKRLSIGKPVSSRSSWIGVDEKMAATISSLMAHFFLTGDLEKAVELHNQDQVKTEA